VRRKRPTRICSRWGWRDEGKTPYYAKEINDGGLEFYVKALHDSEAKPSGGIERVDGEGRGRGGGACSAKGTENVTGIKPKEQKKTKNKPKKQKVMLGNFKEI